MAEAQKKENKQSVAVLDELMSKLAISKVGDEAKGTAIEIAQFINGDIEAEAAPTKFMESIKKMLTNKKDADGRQLVPGIFAAVPYCIDLVGGPYLETHDAVCQAFRPKSAVRPPRTA